MRQSVSCRIEHDDHGVLRLAREKLLPVADARVNKNDFAGCGAVCRSGGPFAINLRLDRGNALVEGLHGRISTRCIGRLNHRTLSGERCTIKHQTRFKRQRRGLAAAQCFPLRLGGTLQLG